MDFSRELTVIGVVFMLLVNSCYVIKFTIIRDISVIDFAIMLVTVIRTIHTMLADL